MKNSYILTPEEAFFKAMQATEHAYEKHATKGEFQQFGISGDGADIDKLKLTILMKETACNKDTLAVAVPERDTYFYCNPTTLNVVVFNQSKNKGTSYVLGSLPNIAPDCEMFLHDQRINFGRRFKENPITTAPHHEVQQASCGNDKEKQQAQEVAQTTTKTVNENGGVLAAVAFGANKVFIGVPTKISTVLETAGVYGAEKILGSDKSLVEIYQKTNAQTNQGIITTKEANPIAYQAGEFAGDAMMMFSATKILQQASMAASGLKFETSEATVTSSSKSSFYYNSVVQGNVAEVTR
jgi:hypothetical protein